MTTEDNRNGNDNIIIIELTEDLKQLGIVTNFIFDKKSRMLILSLNPKYKKKSIISTVFQHNWSKTARESMCEMTSKGMTENHANMLCDIVDNNYEKILCMVDDTNQVDDNQQKRKPKVYIRKYIGNATLPLHESVIITGQRSNESQFRTQQVLTNS